MPSKQTPLRKIDQKNQQEDPRQASLLGGASVEPSTNLTPEVETPTNLSAGATYIVYSHLTPTAAQELSWANADPRTPEIYLVQWSAASNFANPITVSTPRPHITISGLPTATTIYYRVAARIAGQQSAWSASISATTATDTAPPAAVANVQWQWSSKTGDLTITWTPPTSPNYKDTRVVIRAAPNSAVLREAYAVAGRYVWTRAQQASDTNNTYDSNVIVELTTSNTSNVSGSTVSVNPVLSAPSNPTGVTATWDASGTCTIRWNIADVDYYQLTINSVTRNVGYTDTYVYSIGENAADHGGTPNPTLSISVRAIDALRQSSGATTISTTAPLPSTPTGLTSNWSSDNGTAEADCIISWTQVAGVTYRLTIDSVARNVGQVNRYVYPLALNQQEHGGIADPVLSIQLVAVDPFGRASSAASITASNTAPPALTAPSVQGFFSSCRFSWQSSQARDVLRYELDIIVNSASVGIVPVTDTTYTYETTQSGNINARVRAVDRFGQVSGWSGYSTSVQLTSAAQFVQDLRRGVTYRDSINSSASALDVLKDSNLTSGGITYPSAAWQWIEANHNREIRHQTTTFSASTNVQIYMGTSLDGTTWSWHYGGSVSGGVWVPAQTTTVETTAQSGAVTVSGTIKIRLQNPLQCRYIRVGMRNTSASYVVREFYPRSLVQADDIAGETLSTISANLGTITAGSISSVSIDASTITGTAITGGTITGATVQTAPSGARVVMDNTGLYTYDSLNNIVAQMSTATNGTIKVGDNLILATNQIIFYNSLFTVNDNIVFYVNPNEDPFFKIQSIVSSAETATGLLARKKLSLYSYNNFVSTIASLDTQNTQGIIEFQINTGSLPKIQLIGKNEQNNDDFVSLSVKDKLNSNITHLFSINNDGSARFNVNSVVFNNPSSSPILTIRPTASTIQLHANPIISSFANQYTALQFGAPSGQTLDFFLGRTTTDPATSSYTPRWVLRLMPTGDDYVVVSRNDNGSFRHTVLYAAREPGHVGFGGAPEVSGGGVGSIDVYGDVRVRGRIRQKVSWTTFTLASNWSDVGSSTGDPSVGYCVHADGTVELRGVVRMVSGTSVVIATLPTEARPQSQRRAATAAIPANLATFAGAALRIDSNGNLVYEGPALTLNQNYVLLVGRYSLVD